MIAELDKILSTMDIPQKRVSDIHWLSRNLGIRNQNHPDYARAMELIRVELKSL